MPTAGTHENYSPPPGYFDLPFTWVYDASQLTNGLPYPNQYVYLQGGYGDFVLRRIVGLSRILDPSTRNLPDSGQLREVHQFGSNFRRACGRYRTCPRAALSGNRSGEIRPRSDSASGSPDHRPNRLPGRAEDDRRSRPAAELSGTGQFTYILEAPVNSPVGSMVTVRQPVNNYDFELHQIILVVQPPATAFDLSFDAKLVDGGGTNISAPYYLQQVGPAPILIDPNSTTTDTLQDFTQQGPINYQGKKYVLLNTDVGASPIASALWVSSDGGSTWAAVAGGPPAYGGATASLTNQSVMTFDGKHTLTICYVQTANTLAFVDFDLDTHEPSARPMEQPTSRGPNRGSDKRRGCSFRYAPRGYGSLVAIYMRFVARWRAVHFAVHGRMGSGQELSLGVTVGHACGYSGTCVLENGSQALHIFFGKFTVESRFYRQFSSADVLGAMHTFPEPSAETGAHLGEAAMPSVTEYSCWPLVAWA